MTDVDWKARALAAEAERDGLREALAWRPEVRAFADLMEAQLRANDHKPGWKRDHWIDLFYRLREETLELYDALRDADTYDTSDRGARLTREQVFVSAGREAADVANFAMMIADVCGALSPPGEVESTGAKVEQDHGAASANSEGL